MVKVSEASPDLGVFDKTWNLIVTFSQVPTYHLVLEGVLICWVLWLIIRRVSHRRSRIRAEKLTKEEEEELLAEWKPEPLVPDVDPNHPALNVPIVDGKPGKHINIEGKQCLNFATHNYLGFSGNETVEDSAIECMKKFGVGSCGPRAFYGTADVHVHLEEKLASYLQAEQAVLYSYGFSTIASAIPAYAKKGDIIFVDECVNFAIQKGLDASRSKIKYFRHNDVKHLKQLLEQQAVEDKKHPKLAKVSRRFLVVEGIYMNNGNLCKIKEMIGLKREYKLRLFIDESVSFGTIGDHGRGITEHENISMQDVDLIMATLENAIGSIGGFCAGTTYVVEHQTLAGLGYCFSASLPPMLAAGALTALNIMEDNQDMFSKLRNNCWEMHEAFKNIPGTCLTGDINSPVKHLRLAPSNRRREEEREILDQIVTKVREQGIALVIAAYLEDAEVHLPPMSIRLTVSNLLSQEEIQSAGQKVCEICKQVISNPEQLVLNKDQDDVDDKPEYYNDLSENDFLTEPDE